MAESERRRERVPLAVNIVASVCFGSKADITTSPSSPLGQLTMLFLVMRLCGRLRFREIT